MDPGISGGWAMQVQTSVVRGGGLQLPINLLMVQFSMKSQPSNPCKDPSIDDNDDITDITDEEWA
ncbi:hypothetical protein [Nonomuraea helvata]|uniref:Uncharacterized protein n=1 Tax=Nonomuraea helvata TaxID=37484 RepID=A0ABV5SF02_9ACTN